MENAPNESTDPREPAEEPVSPFDETSPVEVNSTPFVKTPRVKDLLFAEDKPSRIATLLSLIFGLLSVTCIALLAVSLVNRHNAATQAERDADAQKGGSEPIYSENIGSFNVVLKSEANQKKDYDLRVDITVECSEQEGCDSLKDKQIEARDLVNPILSSITREEFLTLEGKNRIRRRIAEQLNGIAKGGKVEEVRFTELTIEEGRGGTKSSQ